jgi:hypothetical protein
VDGGAVIAHGNQGLTSLAVLLLTAALGAGAFAAGAEPRKPVRIPGGVADPDLKHGFVRNEAGGIDAIDLTTGSRLWSVAGAAKPLLTHDGRLVVLTRSGPSGGSHVEVLNIGDGKPVLRTGPIAVPGAPAPDQASELKSDVANGTLHVEWATHGRYTGGANAPRDVLQAAQKIARGAVDVDLKSGTVTPAPNREPDRADDQAAVERATRQAARLDPPPFWTGRVCDRMFAALSLAPTDDGDELVLTRWSLTGSAPPTRVVLARGKSVIPVVTDDGGHVLVRQPLPASAPSSATRPAPRAVFSVETGQELTRTLNLESTAEAFTVVDDRILYTLPVPVRALRGPARRVLKAVDVKTGKSLWEFPIAGTANLPPRP